MNKIRLLHCAVCVFLVLSIVFNLYFVFCKDKEVRTMQPNNLSLLDPTIAQMDRDLFLKLKKEYTASYVPLKESIAEIISQSDGKWGVYFEDLTFHSWTGINERDKFKPASLLKVTTVSAVLKEIEEGETSLDLKVALDNDDLNYAYGDLYKKKGDLFTVAQLIEIALVHSDNTAIKALHKLMAEDRWAEARIAMGVPVVSIEESEKGTVLSPKEFSNVFRSLYFAGYLCRTSSNWVLSLLSNTEFTEGIPAGVPKNVKVSHKIGTWASEGSMHDCGIVYANHPYLLCIMSEGTSVEEGTRVIKEISKTVYDYVSSQESIS